MILSNEFSPVVDKMYFIFLSDKMYFFPHTEYMLIKKNYGTVSNRDKERLISGTAI